MSLKIQAKKHHQHHINFNEKYPTWGMKNNLSQQITCRDHLDQCQVIAGDYVPKDYRLHCAHDVSHYQGPKYPAVKTTLLRFTRNGELNLGSEHISLSINLDDAKIYGFCRMVKSCIATREQQLKPLNALQKAFPYLKKIAPELVTIDQCPEFSYPDNRQQGGVCFTHQPINLGLISILWIDTHAEKFYQQCDYADTCGMKIKMRFNDDSERYAWIIIDKQGKPQVFERNIFWDFDQMQRETAMWLHDGWLIAHNLRACQ